MFTRPGTYFLHQQTCMGLWDIQKAMGFWEELRYHCWFSCEAWTNWGHGLLKRGGTPQRVDHWKTVPNFHNSPIVAFKTPTLTFHPNISQSNSRWPWIESGVDRIKWSQSAQAYHQAIWRAAKGFPARRNTQIPGRRGKVPAPIGASVNGMGMEVTYYDFRGDVHGLFLEQNFK